MGDEDRNLARTLFSRRSSWRERWDALRGLAFIELVFIIPLTLALYGLARVAGDTVAIVVSLVGLAALLLWALVRGVEP